MMAMIVMPKPPYALFFIWPQLHSAPQLGALAAKLSQELAAELKAQSALQRLQGMLEPVIAASVGRAAPAAL